MKGKRGGQFVYLFLHRAQQLQKEVPCLYGDVGKKIFFLEDQMPFCLGTEY